MNTNQHDPHTDTPCRIAILTSGGDAQGMNAAVRAVVRTAIHAGAEVYAIWEGYQGAVEGTITPIQWDDVGGTLAKGGTIIGTARSADFRTREGMRRAAKNLLQLGIDRIVAIGGDGSLAGTHAFRHHWPELLEELLAAGEIDQSTAKAHPALMVAGLVGSIDNDLIGSDMTIGADSAMHRILEAIDAISSTAASHQRTFVIEVMGRHCGYLPLFAAIAGGCDYVFVPEAPPEPGWENDLATKIRDGRAAGRRDSLILVAEGAQERDGTPITCERVQAAIHDTTGEDAKITILGHVQRGGTPSAYDRWMSTLLGYAAAQEVLEATPDQPAHIIGVRSGRIARIDLVEAVTATGNIAATVAAGNYSDAVRARGTEFLEGVELFRRLSRPEDGPREDRPGYGKRLAIMHIGGLAPGMNAAARAAVRLGMQRGLTVLGITGGVPGLLDDDIHERSWADVDSWVGLGGAELGVRRMVPDLEHLYAISRTLEKHDVDALMLIGGYNAYLTAHRMLTESERYPALAIPIMCVPASIDNNLPFSELSIGSDSALNRAIWALDAIKESGTASQRCFVTETMGRKCGYLALMAGIATGAERVYLHEEGVTLDDLTRDVKHMNAAFKDGRRLFLAIRNERANERYTADFMARLFEQEAHGLYDVRTAVLGHIQQGGSPSSNDRILAARLIGGAIRDIVEQLSAGRHEGRCVGLIEGEVRLNRLDRIMEHLDVVNRRPKEQWWMGLRPVITALSDPDAVWSGEHIPVLRERPINS
ncbi:6-phosphofructokinase [Dermatophilus congolensis]|uniref:6-phosphofructokinase n=1 Tax=Dermatophilus congolensis TaxID=1863 RepID=A0A239VAW0_9MICO|nr:6-phosphofructokinase [Dermatophilus congolensis]SNV19079.1 6-phosphofructokinase [Dermatophilus congolensis]